MVYICTKGRESISNGLRVIERTRFVMDRQTDTQSQTDKQVCRAQELGSYTQGQGTNQVKGQLVPKIVLLINYWSKFDETSQKDKA